MAAEIKITPEQLKEQANALEALKGEYDSLFSGVNSDLKTLNGNWSDLLAKNFTGKISSAQKSFSAISDMLEAGAKAANQSASTMQSVDSALAKMDLEGAMEKGASAISGAYKSATETQKDINKFIDKVPKEMRKMLKDLYKEATKGTIFEGAEKAYDIWSKIAEGKYGEALESAVKEIGGGLYNAKEGVINWTGVKVDAIIKTVKLCLDEDSYLHANNDKYMDKATELILDGDIAGGIGAIVGSFPQTVGKGAVDVLCQVASGTIDSVVGAATGGRFTLSSFNQQMYDLVGTSPGHIFNDVGNAISDGVDVVIDKGLVGGMSNLGEATGKVASAACEKIGSVFSNIFG